MPVREEISERDGNDSIEAFSEHLRSICLKHEAKVTRVRIERRNRGAGSGPISSSVAVVRDTENPDAPGEVVDQLVDKVVAIIRRDSGVPRGRETKNAGKVAAWHGAAVLLDESKSKSKPTVLDEATLELDDPAEHWNPENELISITRVMTDGYAKMSAATGNLHRWSAQREKAQAKRDREIARLFKAFGKMMGKGSKYDAKARRKEAEKDIEVERARAEASKSKYFWGAVETTGEAWHDVALAWTNYYTAPKEPGEGERGMPRPPTHDELEKVCTTPDPRDPKAPRVAIEDFERRVELDGEQVSVRSLLGEVIAESDVKRRKGLTGKLLALFNRAPAVAMLFKARVVGELGAARARELAAWLQLPV